MGAMRPAWVLQGRGAANRAVRIPVPAAMEVRRSSAKALHKGRRRGWSVRRPCVREHAIVEWWMES